MLPARSIVAAFLAGALAWGCFVTVAAPADWASPGDRHSDSLVLSAVATKIVKGPWHAAGLMDVDHAMIRERLAQVPPYVAALPYTKHLYVSQLGLHATLYSYFAPRDGLDLIAWYARLKYLSIALLVTALAVLAAGLARTHGIVVAVVTVWALALTWPMRAHAGSPYWLLGLHILPAALLLLTYEAVSGARARQALWLALALLVAIKFLCGYEFLTVIVPSLAVPVLYFEVRRGARAGRILFQMLLWAGAAAVGLALALLLHCGQLGVHFGGLSKATDALATVASKRTISNEVYKHTGDIDVLALARTYMQDYAWELPNGGPGLCQWHLVALLSLCAAAMLWRRRARGSYDRAELASLAAAALAIPISLSWIFLVRQHAFTERKICQAMFAIVWLPWIVAHLLATAQRIVHGRIRRRVAAALIALCLLVPGCTQRASPAVYSGSVSFHAVRVGSLVGGRVKRVHVLEGQRVKAGDLVLELESDEVKIGVDAAIADQEARRQELRLLEAGPRTEEIETARAEAARLDLLYRAIRSGARPEEVLAAEQNVATANAVLRDAQDALARAGEERKAAAISEEAFERAKNAAAEKEAIMLAARHRLDLVRAGSKPEEIEAARQAALGADARARQLEAGARPEELAAARAALAEADARLASALARQAELKVLAPSEALVHAFDLREGDLVAVLQPVAVLLLIDDPWVTVYVPERYLAHVNVGQAAAARVDGLDQELRGEVTFVSKDAEFTPRNVQTKEERTAQVFAVKVTLKDAPLSVKSGMWADVELR
jgi:HlyD family secretion protein